MGVKVINRCLASESLMLDNKLPCLLFDAADPVSLYWGTQLNMKETLPVMSFDVHYIWK